MRKEQLTINTALRTIDKMQEIIFGVKGHRTQGFTLIEMIVSLGLFTIIMFVATSAFLSIVNTDRKARSVRIAVDNLNVALEDMSRRIKTGLAYDCNGGILTSTTTVADCASGTMLAFTDQTGTRVVYNLNAGGIERQIFGEPSPTRVTSPEININSLKFVVSGTAPLATPDTQQPMVAIVIDGSLGSGSASTTFKMQTSITQRVYDN